MKSNKRNLSNFILAFLLSARSTRRFYQIINEQNIAEYSERGVRVALSRMARNGYVSSSSNGWTLTSDGCERIHSLNLNSYIPSPFKESSLPNTLVAFDIPEHSRRIRAWLRNQLKIFGYKILQRSLWLGPGPLPKIFQDRIMELGIKKNVKIFTIVKKEK